MDFTRLLLRMVQVVRNPPSPRVVLVGAGVVVLALLIYAIEAAGYWPDWATADRARPPVIRTP